VIYRFGIKRHFLYLRHMLYISSLRKHEARPYVYKLKFFYHLHIRTSRARLIKKIITLALFFRKNIIYFIY